MTYNLQYISDRNGETKAVVIPIKEWLAFKKEYNKLQQIAKLKTSLKNAFREFEEIRNGKKKAVTISEFLNEN